MSATVALVPLRAPGAGKTRLAPALSRTERAALSRAMLADVTAALCACAAVDRVVVAAGGSDAVAAAAVLGLDVVLDPQPAAGLGRALAAAERQVTAERLVVVAADLPCLAADDVAAVLAVDADVVVSPTADGGTAMLVRRPPAVIAASYGPGSAERHAARGHLVGARVAVVDRPGCRHDVDVVDDLVALLDRPVGTATGALLARLAPRLRTGAGRR